MGPSKLYASCSQSSDSIIPRRDLVAPKVAATGRDILSHHVVAGQRRSRLSRMVASTVRYSRLVRDTCRE